MILPVVPTEAAVTEQPVPVPVDEVGSCREVALVTGLAVELDQRRLDLGVAADAVDLPRFAPEAVHHQVGESPGHLQQTTVARRAVHCHRRLDQMTRTVELMTPVELDEPLTRKADLKFESR